MESKENSNPLEINEQKLLEQFLAQMIYHPSQNLNSILEELDESKIMDEFLKIQKVFEDSKEQWKSFIQMIASKYGNSKDELERIGKLKIDVQTLKEFLPKFQISLANYESSLLLNEKYEVYQMLFKKIILIQEKIDNDAVDFKLKKIFIGSVNKFYLEIDEYKNLLSAFKLTNSKTEEQLMNYDKRFKETIEMIDQLRIKIQKLKEKTIEDLKRCQNSINLNIKREKLNHIIQNPLKVIKMVEIDEISNREPFFEMDINEELGYTAKSFFSNKNGIKNFYIYLIENKTGETIQEIMIKEFENGSFPICKWNNTKKIRESKLAVYTYGQTFGFILEMDENSKKLKENYQKLEIGKDFNHQIIYSEKNAIINHGNSNGITVFDSKTLQKIENVQGSSSVIVGEFFEKENYIYPDYDNKIFKYNLKTKKQQIVNGNHPEDLICSMNISKESNTLILGHYNGNVYIYKLNLRNKQFVSILKSISTVVSEAIYRMEFISIDKLMIANYQQKNLRIVDINSGKIEEKEIIKGNQLGIEDFKFNEKNGIIVVLTCDSVYNKSQIHFLSE